jgi:hypothetical protein
MTSTAAVRVQSVVIANPGPTQTGHPLDDSVWTVCIELSLVERTINDPEIKPMSMEFVFYDVHSVDEAVLRALEMAERFGNDVAKECRKAIQVYESSQRDGHGNQT